MNTFQILKSKKPYSTPLLIWLWNAKFNSAGFLFCYSGGADFVGIAQTGTGKNNCYLLPVLQDLTFSEQANPRVLILAPTRELVIQIGRTNRKINALIIESALVFMVDQATLACKKSHCCRPGYSGWYSKTVFIWHFQKYYVCNPLKN